MATFQRKECVILTNEVSDWFESFLLSHNKLNGLLLAITHELSVSNSSLFPLLVAPSEKLGPDLHDALQVLFSRGNSLFWNIDLLIDKTV